MTRTLKLAALTIALLPVVFVQVLAVIVLATMWLHLGAVLAFADR